MFKLNAERALARHLAGADSASPASGGGPPPHEASPWPPFSIGLRSLAAAVAGLPPRLFDRLLDGQERSRQRHALMALDDRMLRDIGLSRAEAEGEYRKPSWRP